MSNDQVVVTHAEDRTRYEAHVDGVLAGFADYVRDGDVLTFPHTEVDDSFGGQGVGSALVRGALDDVGRLGATVVPSCSFVRAYIDRHPEYQPLLAPRP